MVNVDASPARDSRWTLFNGLLISCGSSRNCFTYRDQWWETQTIEITDPLEAHAAVCSNTGAKECMLNGSLVTGTARAVKEDRPSTPTRWTVPMIPKQGSQPNRYSEVR
jgi:hypothetical protein